ncbi:pantoate kinase [Methanothermobacter tenebrarum]
MKVEVFVPAHITGFFQIIEDDNPLKMGSRGAGVVINKGVRTKVKFSRSDKQRVIVDGVNDFITWKVLEILNESFELPSLKVYHELEVPIGCGFGVSGACALGTSLGISRLLKLPLTVNGAASIAHRAEVELGTGLGDVIAELNGGICLRLREGAPGHGITDRIIYDPLYVVCKVFGELDTATVIKDPKSRDMINFIGSGMLKRLVSNPTPENFMGLSYEFAEKTKLLTRNVKEHFEIIEEEVIGASMAMLGDTIFALSKEPDTSLDNPIIAKIDSKGARFIQ